MNPARAEEQMIEEKAKPLSLRINFSWTLAGNVAYAATQWAIVAAIAKLGTPAMVGRFSLALAITAPVFMFTNLNLRGVQATDAKGDFAFRDYVLLRVAMTALALVAVAAILLLTGYDRDVVFVCIVVALAKAVESMSDVCYGLMQRHERMDPIAHSMIARGGISLLAVVLLLATTGNLLVAVTGLAFSWTAVFIFHDVRKTRFFLPPRPSSGAGTRWPSWGVRTQRLLRVRELAVLALPLGLVMMLVSLNANIPRYFVEWELGEEALGYYSALAYLTIAAGTVVNALGQAAAPQLAQRYASHEPRRFTTLLLKLAGIAVALGFCGWAAAGLFGEAILTLLYTADYASYVNLFAWLMAVTIVQLVASAMGYGMTAMRKFKIMPPIFALATVANAVFCAVLIPKVGLMGAVWALLIAGLVQAIASAWVILSGVRG